MTIIKIIHRQKKPLPWEEIQGRGNTGVKDIFIVLMITEELLAGLSIHTSRRWENSQKELKENTIKNPFYNKDMFIK